MRRAIEAVNAERAAGTDIAPNDYLSTYVARGKAALERKTAEGADAELDAKGERQLMVPNASLACRHRYASVHGSQNSISHS